jgi:hypothetical protein
MEFKKVKDGLPDKGTDVLFWEQYSDELVFCKGSYDTIDNTGDVGFIDETSWCDIFGYSFSSNVHSWAYFPDKPKEDIKPILLE